MLYWSIHFYDRTLLVDPAVAPQLPLLADMSFHLVPTLVLLVDTLFFSPPWETHALSALMYFSVFAAGYWMWIEHCFSYNNFYPYPMMGLMNNQQRALLFAFATLLCWSSFLTVRLIYRTVNGEIQVQREASKKEM
jgi:FAR-17a/AIG1-like protein